MSNKPYTVFLFEFMERYENKELQVPSFQRKFVWTKQQQIELYSSIKEDIPIGNFIIWENSQGKWILDGQQRIRSLYKMLYTNKVFYCHKTDTFTFKKTRISTSIFAEGSLTTYFNTMKSFLDSEGDDKVLRKCDLILQQLKVTR